MLVRYLGYWLRLALGLFVVAVLAILAGYLGFFGGTVHTLLLNIEKAIQGFYQGDTKFYIDRALASITAGASAFLAVVAVYRPYHYAEFNLPGRMTDYVRRAVRRVIEDREILIAEFFGSGTLKGFSGPTINKALSNRLWSSAGLTSAQRAIRRLSVPEGLLDSEISILGTRKAFCETQRITAHLVRGLQLATEAAMKDSDDVARSRLNGEALDEFQKALRVNVHDLDALQQTAWLFNELGDEAHAIKHLERLAAAAQKQNKPVRQAKALRYHAKILEKRETRKAWNQARPLLVAAVDILERAEERGPDRDDELALASELLGALQIKREKFSAARQALKKAQQAYDRLPSPQGPAGKPKLEALLTQITQNEDEPDEPEPDVIYVKDRKSVV